MKTSPIMLVLSGLLGLTACERIASAPDRRIAFRQSGCVFTATASTRASVVDVSTLNAAGFNVSCTTGAAGSEVSVWNNAAFHRSGDRFVSGDGGHCWPAIDLGYHFAASNAALSFSPSGTTVSATNATDVVCAYLPDPTFNAANTLQFKHIFARLCDVTFSALDGYSISGISVTLTPKTGGTYNLRTGNGRTDGTGWSDMVEGSAVPIAAATPGTQANDLYLVPGTYTLSASWTASKGAFTRTYSNKTCEVSLVGGSCNSITASLTGNATEVEYSVGVTAWGSNTIAIGTYPHWDIPATFAGLNIAPANLYYGPKEGESGNQYYIKDNDWNHGSWGSVYGVNAGSYYFSPLAASFRTSYYHYDDWRMPTRDEINAITGTARPGSTVNNKAHCHFTRVSISGSTFLGTNQTRGLLLFPDNEVITTSAGTSYIDQTNNFTSLSVAQLNGLLSAGCAFLPAGGYYDRTKSKWTYTYNDGIFWSCSTASGSSYYTINISTSISSLTSTTDANKIFANVRLVRTATDYP